MTCFLSLFTVALTFHEKIPFVYRAGWSADGEWVLLDGEWCDIADPGLDVELCYGCGGWRLPGFDMASLLILVEKGFLRRGKFDNGEERLS